MPKLNKQAITGMPNGGFRTNGVIRIKTRTGTVTNNVPKAPSDLTYRGGKSLNPNYTNITVNRPKGV